MYVGRFRDNWNHTAHIMANMAAVMTGQQQHPDKFNAYSIMFARDPSDAEVAASLDFFAKATGSTVTDG
jgi:TPP-dependent indolepyruvate ferredoxin oxidoreductase alpha subunit